MLACRMSTPSVFCQVPSCPPRLTKTFRGGAAWTTRRWAANIEHQMRVLLLALSTVPPFGRFTYFDSPSHRAVSSATKSQRRPQAYADAPVLSEATTSPVGRRILPLVVLLFIGSGCAALIYEIVWFQLLSLIIGSSAVSMAVLLGTFMGGMCIGSLFLSRFVSRQQHPLRVYAKLELAIAVFGLLVLWGLPYAGGLYFAIGLH